MSNEEYQLLEIETGRSYVPRALILCLKNGKPTALYQVDLYGYEFPAEMDCELGCKDAGDHYHDPSPKENKTHE